MWILRKMCVWNKCQPFVMSDSFPDMCKCLTITFEYGCASKASALAGSWMWVMGIKGDAENWGFSILFVAVGANGAFKELIWEKCRPFKIHNSGNWFQMLSQFAPFHRTKNKVVSFCLWVSIRCTKVHSPLKWGSPPACQLFSAWLNMPFKQIYIVPAELLQSSHLPFLSSCLLLSL